MWSRPSKDTGGFDTGFQIQTISDHSMRIIESIISKYSPQKKPEDVYVST